MITRLRSVIQPRALDAPYRLLASVLGLLALLALLSDQSVLGMVGKGVNWSTEGFGIGIVHNIERWLHAPTRAGLFRAVAAATVLAGVLTAGLGEDEPWYRWRGAAMAWIGLAALVELDSAAMARWLPPMIFLVSALFSRYVLRRDRPAAQRWAWGRTMLINLLCALAYAPIYLSVAAVGRTQVPSARLRRSASGSDDSETSAETP
ncbi:hypothetical protein [Nocardia sp. alder85J]|uniref:hypothetical protein n=1 Tax=Nocardia sp. alder85J TaxID=2862949 RepID=UPI001CD69A80|nr:hypothetical protein [Nocardia sp. alder85J]MCX4099045.1 hypothetical protein [Nocardia sp. alder85J]